MPIVSDYAARTPAEQAFADMLAEYDVSIPDVESFFDPRRCPEEFLPYLAQSYYADTYSDALGTAYNREAVAQAHRINQIRGTWGAALQVARNARVLAYVEYRRGPGLVVSLRLSPSGAGVFRGVSYGAVWPRGGVLPGGVAFRGLEIPTTGQTIILHGAEDLQAADWPDDGYALSTSALTSGGAEYPAPLTKVAGIHGSVTLSGKTATIFLGGDTSRLRTAAASGATITLAIRPGQLPPGTPNGWAARRAAWRYTAPLRNTGVNISVAPLGGLAATDYTQAMAHIFNRVLPYRVTVNDVHLLNPLTVPTGLAPIPAAQHLVYQGYRI